MHCTPCKSGFCGTGRPFRTKAEREELCYPLYIYGVDFADSNKTAEELHTRVAASKLKHDYLHALELREMWEFPKIRDTLFLAS